MGFVVNDRRTIYLGVNSNGNLYESSKEPKDGFVPHKNEQTGSISYWREHPYGLDGYLDDISVRTFKNASGQDVEQFSMVFKDYETGEYLSVGFPLYTSKGNIHRYVKSFVKFYKNLDFSRCLRLNPYKRKAGDQYAPTELGFYYVAPGASPIAVERYFKKGLNGWPEVGVKKEYGKDVSDYTAQNNFTYDRLMEYIGDFRERIGQVRAGLESQYETAPAPQQPVQGVPEAPAPQPGQYESQASMYQGNPATAPASSPKKQAQPAPVVQGDDDDLPF